MDTIRNSHGETSLDKFDEDDEEEENAGLWAAFMNGFYGDFKSDPAEAIRDAARKGGSDAERP